jgi:hypothetical protein
MSVRNLLILVAAVLTLARPALADDDQAQPNPNAGSLRVTVLDQTGAAIVGASVTVAQPPPATPRTVVANDRGEALFDNLDPGKYLLHVESTGFESIDMPDLNVRRGRQERREIRLEIGKYVEEVEVTRDKTDEVLNDSFSSALTQEQIDALPDDEEEMQQQLEQMAGPGAVLRVNGFSGGRLPPKSQIAEIRFRFDPYSAENHESGFPRVDIRTRPGNGNWRNSAGFTFRDESLNARNAFAESKGAEQARRYQWSIDGPIAKGKTSFSLFVGGLSSYDSQTILARDETGEIRGLVNQPNDRVNLNARVEHALTKNQMLRIEFSRNSSQQSNLGVGDYDLYDRAYEREQLNNEFRLSTSGPLGRTMRNEVRFEFDWDDSSSSSFSDAVTVLVQGAQNFGGAQVSGGRRSKTIEFADNLDFTLGKRHSLRAGVLVEGGWYRGDERRNFNGTYTFSSLDAYLARQPLQFSRRIGDPLVEYQSWQAGLYISDDIRVRKNLMMSVGLRAEAQTHLQDNVNLAPRFNMTWSPFKSNKTTFRAGAGIFYDWYETSLYETTLQLDGARQNEEIIRNPGYPNPQSGGTLADPLPPSVTRASSELVMPTVKRASFGLEHAATGWMQLRANYFVQHTADVYRAVNPNTPINGVRPDALLGNVTFVDAIGREESQGMDLSLNLNYAPKRIFGTVNYRLARSMSDGDSATSLPVNGVDLDGQWGPSRNDVRHRVFGFVTSPLPWGLRVNTNMMFQSGMPYTVTTGFDDNGDSVINDRPAGVGRNSARGDSQFTMDLRLGWSKGFGKPKTGDGQPGGPGGGPVVIRQVGPGGGGGGGRGGPGGGGGGFMGGGPGGPGGNTGRVNLEIFVQANNVLNSVNYMNYTGILTSADFGLPRSAQPGRRIEVGTRVGF